MYTKNTLWQRERGITDPMRCSLMASVPEAELCRGGASSDLSDAVTSYISSSPRNGDGGICLVALRELIDQVRNILPKSPLVVIFDAPYPALFQVLGAVTPQHTSSNLLLHQAAPLTFPIGGQGVSLSGHPARHQQSAYSGDFHLECQQCASRVSREDCACACAYARPPCIEGASQLAMAAPRCWPKERYGSVPDSARLLCAGRHAVTRHATPRHITPRHATPRHATSRHATPHHATPRHTTLRYATPCHNTPLHFTPHHFTSHHVMLCHATPRQSTQRYATLRHATPLHGTTREATSRHSTPRYNTPHHTTPRHPMLNPPRPPTPVNTTPPQPNSRRLVQDDIMLVALTSLRVSMIVERLLCDPQVE